VQQFIIQNWWSSNPAPKRTKTARIGFNH